MSRPFKLGDPVAKNVSVPADRNATAKPPGEAAKKAATDGEFLVDAGQEVGTPAYDVGEIEEAGDDGQGAKRAPAVPWPPAQNGKRPFKL